MLIVEDPLLALIVRFVADPDQPDSSNDEFIKRQIRALKEYTDGFPEEERSERAMEWIEQHARSYRRGWQRRKVSRDTPQLRCPDCPLQRLNAAEHCEIHEQWLYLLRRYINGEVTSKKYVKKALRLLKEHKKQLRRRTRSDKQKAVSAKRLRKTLA
jgi:hypothetical protein